MALTADCIETRRHYARLYWNWPVILILAHLADIDEQVAKMHPDEMIEARSLMDSKLPLWR